MGSVGISFLLFLGLFLGVGVISARRRKKTTEDYLVASRGVGPVSVALSAVATNNSGFMFIGLIGATYLEGISAMWLMVGWVFGDYLAWLLRIPDRLRERSGESGALTIPSFLGDGLRGGRGVTVVAGIIVLCFLGTYAAAQLTAGSKALHVIFGWEPWVGAVIGAGIVLVYCEAGGIRASIWTDVAQSIVMFFAMILLFVVGVAEAGGLGEMWAGLALQDPALTTVIPDTQFGFALFMLGWLGAGFGVVGQPHIMVRAMTLDDPTRMATVRRIYFTWYTVFSAAAIGMGLAARAIFPDIGPDAELAMPLLAQELLPGVLTGLVLAGLFAATMSTADSQILSCSAAITQDILRDRRDRYGFGQLATAGVTGLVLIIALMGGSVFTLVVFAWSALASCLGPLLIVRALGGRPSALLANLMMAAGLIAVLLWRFVFELQGAIYDVLPGMVTGFAVYALLRGVLSVRGESR